MAEALKKYRVWCEVDSQYEYVWIEDPNPAPTVCPVDSGHAITTSKTTIVDIIENLQVDISGTKVDKHGHLGVINDLGIGGGIRLVSHNYCDKLTWWQKSTREQDKATTTADDLVYDITNEGDMVDLRHGRMTYEDAITTATVGPDGTVMEDIVPIVKVDGTPLLAVCEDLTDDQHANYADRYSIDYSLGKVTFVVARTGSPTITVSFRKAGSSVFCFKPGVGKKWTFNDAEIDVSEDIDFIAPFRTGVSGSHTTLTGDNIVPLGSNVYKTMHDFQSIARKFWGPLPAGFGGVGGIASPKWTFEWNYSRSDVFYNSKSFVDQNIDPAGVTWNYVEISVDGDVELAGSYLTITYYGSELAEDQEV